jgi:peptide/nickel transport system substrate-binding protein
MDQTSSLRALFDSFRQGELDRRAFIQGASALGVSAAGAVFLANTAAAQTPAASPVAGVAVRPTFGTENQTRGEGGALNLIQWQAPGTLSPHLSTGSKDFLASMLVLEPLIHYSPESEMIPNLITELPTVENGMLAEDLTSVTFSLLPDVVWSDGTPFTAADVAFTTEWVKDPANNSVNQGVFAAIESAEVVDDLTVTINFVESNPFWFDPFTGTATGFVYPKHVLESGPAAHDAFSLNPVGTGPYVVEAFTPNDSASYVVNENYREPNKPFFATVQIKGGGDAANAARAVLQTGEFDFAWKLQVEPDLLDSMVADDAPGALMQYPGVAVERLNFQFADPWTEHEGQRAHKDTQHPFLSDPAVREAIAIAIDRELIADSFYGNGQEAATNLLYGDPLTESENTTREFDPEKAAQILEEAGWTMDGDVRSKDGVELRSVLATSVNPVRQKTQAVIKSNLEAIGIGVELVQVDASTYFDSAPGNDQNIGHFFWDMNMLQSVPNSPRPMQSMETWYAGPDGSNIAQMENDWSGQNPSRYQSEEYDALLEAARVAIDADELAELFIGMNDHLVNNRVIVPLVVAGEPRAVSRRIRQENIALAPFSGDYWNIANWNLADGAEG